MVNSFVYTKTIFLASTIVSRNFRILLCLKMICLSNLHKWKLLLTGRTDEVCPDLGKIRISVST